VNALRKALDATQFTEEFNQSRPVQTVIRMLNNITDRPEELGL
jgi:hypothetical protein